MSTAEFPQVGAVEAGDFRFAYWAEARRCALGLYLVSLVTWSAHYGIPVQRELVIAWVCGALACTLLGRPPRQALHLLRDWLPIVAVLCAYDYTRGAADSLGIGDRPAFLRFTKRLVSLALAGLATYIAFPAAPPWMASEMGLLGEIHRTTPDGWGLLGMGTAGLFSKGQSSANMVAAVPSLHSAFTALVVLFLWKRVRPRLRPLLALYPLAMGLTLMATGEHYFFDVLLGWLYAGAAMAAWLWWERRHHLDAGSPGPKGARTAAGRNRARRRLLVLAGALRADD